MNPVNDKLHSAIINEATKKTPMLLMDLSDVRKKYKSLKRNLPGYTIHYAVKCNPEPEILEELNKLGSSFEIASIGEMKRLKKIGVDPAKVIYSNPVKPIKQIKKAFEMGVKSFAYDSHEELVKIANAAPGAEVYLRMSVSNHGSLINLANKFGAHKYHCVDLISLAGELGLDANGISFHVGSQSESLTLWDQAFEDVIDILNQLQERGIKLKYLNIGGGFPVRYREPVPKIEEIGARIAKNMKKLPYKMEMLCEPGRYLVGEAGVIVAEIIGKTIRYNKPWIFVDAGRFQAFVEMFESESLEYPIYTSIDDEPASKAKSLYTVTGPSCDSHDTISRDVSLPTNLEVGDRIYFGSAGAYTHVYGSAFNDFPVPKVKFI